MKTLKQKLATVAAAVQTVGKSGYNAKQNYHYVRAADVVRKIREELLNEGVIVSATNRILSVVACKTKLGGDAWLTTLELTLTFHDVDSAEFMQSITIGQGWDTNDKGIAKAMTMAYKYSLIEPFMIEMTDDPEADANADELTDDAKRPPAAQTAAPASHKCVGDEGLDTGYCIECRRPMRVIGPSEAGIQYPRHKCVGDENGYCVTCGAVLGDMAYENDELPQDIGQGARGGGAPQKPSGQPKEDALPSTCPDCNRKLYTTYAPSNKEYAGKPLRDTIGRLYARCAACKTMWYADGTGYNPKTKEKK